LGRIGLEIRSVGKNWVRGKISGEELGSRKDQWGRIGFEERSIKNIWVRGKISQEQLGSRKNQSGTIGVRVLASSIERERAHGSRCGRTTSVVVGLRIRVCCGNRSYYMG
jgi:hypothetical protein